AVERFHPWIFSGAVKHIEGNVEDGDVVEVYKSDGSYLATGHYQNGSITVRLFSFQQVSPDQNFWDAKIGKALQYRRHLGLASNRQTNCFRLTHAEGDGLPGLIIDLYHKTAVVQCHSIGMHREMDKISQALQNNFGDQLEAIYDKSAESLPSQYATEVENRYVFGKGAPGPVLEYGHAFQVDWEEGQKTGFFLDQRENRRLAGLYAKDKKVLNAFCYSGGFSIYALQAGARFVDSVDVSKKAIELTEANVALNGLASERHQSHALDVMDFLRSSDKDYELMVVDPPAFAKSLKKRHQAVQGYKRLNALAMSRIRPGGLLFTFSCSQVVDQALFYNTIVAAALESGRQARVMHQLSQPPDHPVSIFHSEGSYLKGLVLYIE
ncbi:MAG: class I SAM-dependent rRNA methyltransferase, partial [Phaeodactylibacter sp.]|nr:class I SAM-dependent rRNA methyltransferase [Phaeodactylibacter sp.]